MKRLGILLMVLAVGWVPTIALVSTAPLLAGCKTAQPDPVSLRAEQIIRVSFEVVNAFLDYEMRNRGIMPVEAMVVADRLRATYPTANQSAWKLLREYRLMRDSHTRVELEVTLSYLTSLMSEAQRVMATLQH